MAATLGGSSATFSKSSGPVASYLSLDFASITEDLTRYAQASYADRWTDFNPNHFAVVFRDLISYLHDLVTFNLNAAARELSYSTAQRRLSVANLSKSFGYELASASPTSGPLTLVTTASLLPITIDTTHEFGAGDVVFQPDQSYILTTANGVNNGDGTYTHAGIVTVQEGQNYFNVSLGSVSDGSADQIYDVPQAFVIDGTLHVFVNGVEWTKVPSLVLSGPADTHFRAEVDDFYTTRIYFGDGSHGAVPTTGATISSSWTSGGGVRGRVGANTITDILTSITGVVSVTNPSAFTSGGEEAESIAQAKAKIPAAVYAGDHCITDSDYAIEAAKASTSVSKVSARTLADGRTVEICVSPAGGGVPSSALKATVAAHLATRKMSGRQLKFRDPTYTGLDVWLDIFVKSSQVSPTLVSAVQQLFATVRNDQYQAGLFDLVNMGFGGRDIEGNPQITPQIVYDQISSLASLGIQSSRLRRLTNIPQLRPVSPWVAGNSYLTASTFQFTTGDYNNRRRRSYRLVFVSATDYVVYERLQGTISAITRTWLQDDKLLLDFSQPLPSSSMLYPRNDSASFVVDTAASMSETASHGVATFVVNSGLYSLASIADVGDAYTVEYFSGVGSIGGIYTPPANAEISWTINQITPDSTHTAYAPGDEFLVTVCEGVGSVLLDQDEIPFVSAETIGTNFVVNVISAM